MVLFKPMLEDKRVLYRPPNVISPKISVLARLEFDLTYVDVEVQHFSHYATGSTSDLELVEVISFLLNQENITYRIDVLWVWIYLSYRP